MVIGGGPLGLACTGRLLDFADAFAAEADEEWVVHWVDPSFEMGRMGKYFRNVPSNTNNADYLTAFRLVKSFEFDKRNAIHRSESDASKANCSDCRLTDLEPDACVELGVFVDTALEAQQHIMPRVNSHVGVVTHIRAMPTQRWRVSIQYVEDGTVSEVDCDAVVYCCGCQPVVMDRLNILKNNMQAPYVVLPAANSSEAVVEGCAIFDLNGGAVEDSCAVRKYPIVVHSLDYAVDPNHCKRLVSQPINKIVNDNGPHRDMLLRDDSWAVVGSSHSAMLVVMNLHKAGVRDITLLHQSDFRFMYRTADGWMRLVLYRMCKYSPMMGYLIMMLSASYRITCLGIKALA